MSELPNINALLDLTGQVAIVTGGAEGMGKETCRVLASAGAIIAVVDINLPWASRAADEIVASGGKAKAYALDLAVEESIITVVKNVHEEFGRLDILVNVAGLQDREVLEETSVALWDKLHHVNLRGPFLMIREFAKAKRSEGSPGRIVNVSSMGALHPVFEGLVAYNATKAGINGVTRNAAFELAEHGITVNAILPGNTTTKGQARSPGPPIDPATITRLVPPLGRTGNVSDIANGILFLASPMSQWMTGQLLVIDGGHLNS
jgi:NAD(P)-dependent dehydrogenase (short-subunit alcohol dehydrogenase family)